MRLYPGIGVQAADILLPKSGTNLTQWASIACDQFTSQPEYWQKVAETVGDAPSTFKLTLPEVYLGTDEEAARERRRLRQAAVPGEARKQHVVAAQLPRLVAGQLVKAAQ